MRVRGDDGQDDHSLLNVSPHGPSEEFVSDLVEVFRSYEDQISTTKLKKGRTSDQVLAEIRPDLGTRIRL